MNISTWKINDPAFCASIPSLYLCEVGVLNTSGLEMWVALSGVNDSCEMNSVRAVSICCLVEKNHPKVRSFQTHVLYY
jgi:hypothetical protein